MRSGDQLVYERTFTAEEVLRFAEMTGDRGEHHLNPDAKGRLMLHGLLTASMPTKLGGDMHFIAREMHFEFLKPAWSGQPLRCVGTVNAVVAKPTRRKVAFSFEVFGPGDELLLRGSSAGNIFKPETEQKG